MPNDGFSGDCVGWMDLLHVSLTIPVCDVCKSSLCFHFDQNRSECNFQAKKPGRDNTAHHNNKKKYTKRKPFENAIPFEFRLKYK